MSTRMIDVIETARRTLWLSIWPQDSQRLVDAVRSAVARRVDVFTIVYGDGLTLPGRVYVHSYSSPAAVYERLGCRLGICVADHDQATIGGVTASATWGIWSDDRAVALLAAEHVRHDIALQLTCERLAAAGLEDFWSNDPDLEALRDASAAAMAATVDDQ